jgi:hypothetical protein
MNCYSPRRNARDQDLDCPADRDPYSDRHKRDRLRDGSGLQLNSLRARMEAGRDALLRGNNPSTVIVDSEVGDTLARDMIEVHGTEATTIARDNARAAALAAQIPEAKAWIRVLGIIQRIRPDHGLDP